MYVMHARGSCRDSRTSSPFSGMINSVLNVLAAHPHLLQVAAICIGLLLVVQSLSGGGRVTPSSTGPAAHMSPAPSTLATPQGSHCCADPLAVVEAYNSATIQAGASGSTDHMKHFVQPDSLVWQAIQQEFARRKEQGERHYATLVRWGLIKQAVTTTTAQIETQEHWDDLTEINGIPTDARRGMVRRIRYDLQREHAADPWRIVGITTTPVIQ